MQELRIKSRRRKQNVDSDFVLVTNHAVAVNAALKAYKEFPTIVNELKESGITYNNTPKDYALMDNRFARSQLAIGESSNVAQLAMSYFWDNPCKELYDNFVILSVLAQAAIDSIKRIYEVDVQSEINRIKKLPSMVREKRLPYFMKYTKKVQTMKNGKERAWEDVKKDKEKLYDKIDNDINCPMNYLIEALNNVKFGRYGGTVPTEEFFTGFVDKPSKGHMGKLRKIASECNTKVQWIRRNIESAEDRMVFIQQVYDDAVEEMQKIKTKSPATINRLVEVAFGYDRNGTIGVAENKVLRKYTRVMLKLLYRMNRDAFLSCFLDEKQYVEKLGGTSKMYSDTGDN